MMKQMVHGTFPIVKPPRVRERGAPAEPLLPSSWECTALLHPFSPPPAGGSQGTPFFQLCIAAIAYIADEVLSVQITGIDDGGTWWYKITSSETFLSLDQGSTWNPAATNWILPTVNWFAQTPTFFATSYLNWMEAQEVDWWKQPVAGSNATTWIWFDSETQLPFRMMFGAPPPTPFTGDPAQLGFFQNFSFTYFPTFEPSSNPNVDTWAPPVIAGFQPGNPGGGELVVWNDCFVMTTLMTPVDAGSMPLPTAVLYQWKADADYISTTDRAQLTVMSYEHNPTSGMQVQVALLYGAAPAGTTPPPYAGEGYIYNETAFLVRGYPEPIVTACQNIGLGAEPPNWASIPAVEGTIHASVTDNAALSPGVTVDIISVLFPPSPEYPQGRFLWTWYSPFPGSDGTHSRPVTFMESASTIAEGGTSLALADYFQYFESDVWFPSYPFDLPTLCSTVPAPT